MKTKKILILDTGKEWGGGTNSLIELLKRIDRKRYKFSALFYNNYKKGGGPDIKCELTGLGVEFILIGRGKKRFYSKALKEIMRPLLSLSSELKKKYVFYHDYIERILPDSKRIASVLKDGDFDLLYMNNQPSSNLEGILAAKAAGVPCIQHSRVEVSLNRFEADAVNSSVEKIICVSRGVRDALIKSGVRPERCAVVYNGIDGSLKPGRNPDELRKSAGIPEKTFLIGSAGSLIKRKRVDLLIDAVSLLKGEDIACLIVGDGPEMEHIKKKVRSLGIENRVIFTGFSADPISCINAMDAFVLPSRTEGLPRVILEAMLMAKPVIAFNVTGPSELVEHNSTGILLDKENAIEVADAVKRLRDDSEKRRRMGLSGRNRVIGEFGIDKYVSGVESVFREVLR